MDLNELRVLGCRLSSCLELEQRALPASRPSLSAIVFLSRDISHFEAYSLALAWGSLRGIGSWPLIERLGKVSTKDFTAPTLLAAFRQLASRSWRKWDEADAFIAWCEAANLESGSLEVHPISSPRTLVVAARDILQVISPEVIEQVDGECTALVQLSTDNPATEDFETAIVRYFA